MPSLSKELVALLSTGQTTVAHATDALEEYILHRRSKGDTLFDVSVGLIELEDKASPHLLPAFYAARYVANVPPPSDLTPPTGPFPLARSASSASVLHHLLSHPTPSLQHSREVILEFVLAREGKLREKKPGRGGKGTLGREGFEDIARRLGEIEDGLKGLSPTSPRNGAIDRRINGSGPTTGRMNAPDLAELDEPRQIGLMLVLSIRMSLSYFTLHELAQELLGGLALEDAERMLVQHIRRRLSGEGRFGVGKELEYVESMTLPQRPALRPAFRSAKARTHLPKRPTYPISLPAPGKSACIKLLSTFCKDIELGGPLAAASFMQSPLSPSAGSHPFGYSYGYSHNQSTAERGAGFLSKRSVAGATVGNLGPGGSPISPIAALPQGGGGGGHAPLGSPSYFSYSPQSHNPPEPGPNPVGAYALELISEFVTREKREYMLKNKWVKSGYDQLGKDLGEIEAALCMSSKAQPSQNAPLLLPTFLLLRRTFALPASPLPSSITEPYLDILPAPPDPDSIPFREVTVSSTTAALYVNPRLNDSAALDALEELIESEREKVEAAGGNKEELNEWLLDLVQQVEKRFPDGSYASIFALARANITRPRPLTNEFPPSTSPVPILRQQSSHRRTQSTVVPASSSQLTSRLPHSNSNLSSMLSSPSHGEIASIGAGGYGGAGGGGDYVKLSGASPGGLKFQHTRSASMPMRGGTYDEKDSDEDEYEGEEENEVISSPGSSPQPVRGALHTQTQLQTQPLNQHTFESLTAKGPFVSISGPAPMTTIGNGALPAPEKKGNGVPFPTSTLSFAPPRTGMLPTPIEREEAEGISVPYLASPQTNKEAPQLPPTKRLPPLDLLPHSTSEGQLSSSTSAGEASSASGLGGGSGGGGGWWDIVSAVEPDPDQPKAPWQHHVESDDEFRAGEGSHAGKSPITRLSVSTGNSVAINLPLPQGAAPAIVQIAGTPPPSLTRFTDLDLARSGGGGGGGGGGSGWDHSQSSSRRRSGVIDHAMLDSGSPTGSPRPSRPSITTRFPPDPTSGSISVPSNVVAGSMEQFSSLQSSRLPDTQSSTSESVTRSKDSNTITPFTTAVGVAGIASGANETRSSPVPATNDTRGSITMDPMTSSSSSIVAWMQQTTRSPGRQKDHNVNSKNSPTNVAMVTSTSTPSRTSSALFSPMASPPAVVALSNVVGTSGPVVSGPAIGGGKGSFGKKERDKERPPPVPLNFERPSFPGWAQTPSPPLSATFGKEPGIGGFDGAGGGNSQPSTPTSVAMNGHVSGSGTGPMNEEKRDREGKEVKEGKSKLFGRSMTLANKSRKMARALKDGNRKEEKEKEKEKEKENDRYDRYHDKYDRYELFKDGGASGRDEKDGLIGNGGIIGRDHKEGKDKRKEKEKEKEKERWNRDMVVGIMGPPAERRQ